MKTTLPWRLRLLLPVLAIIFGCGRKSNEPVLHVVAHAPNAATDDAKAPIRISFDRPAVAQNQVGRALREIPLKVSPKIPLSAHWIDRQTLVATPTTTWSKATRYEVAITGALADRLSDDFELTFEHDPLDVMGPTGINRRWVEPKPEFSLVFDQKVKARDVVEHCKLVAPKPDAAVALVARDPQRVEVDISLGTAAALKQGQSYTLRCEKLPPAVGNAVLAKPYETTLDVYPTLSLKNATPASGARVTPDELTLALTFSTPIDRAELRKHVRLTPRHPALKRDWLERNETVNELSASFEADTTYTLEIDGKLRDRFGQKLGKTQTIKFDTTNAAPSMSVSNGIFAIEADAAGYPVWSRNVDSFSLECAFVPKANIVKVLTAQISYDVWYDKDHPNTLDFKALGLNAKRSDVDTGSKKNKWTKTPLALGERCAGGARGLYLAELRAPLVEERRKEHGGIYPYRLLGNVTNLGVLLKVGPGSGLVWVASLAQAAPIEGASITLFDTSGRRVFAGNSDARGILMLPGSDKLLTKTKAQSADADPYEEGGGRYRDQRLIAVVEKDGDLAVVDGNWSDGISAWNFNLSVDQSGGEVATRGFIETDRGIYRPGETVHVKGLVRDVPLAGDPRVPSSKQIQVHVEDGNGAELFDKSLALSEFGGFFFDLALDAEARTGDYYVKATLGKQTFNQTFSVEEIRPVTFEITTQNLKENIKLGATSKLQIEARYLFGAPVTDAEVSYEVQRRRHWLYFPEFSSYSFEDWSDEEWTPWWEPENNNGFVSEGKGRTDAKGRYTFEVKDEEKGLTGPQDYVVRTSVRDAADQEVTKRIAITGHPSDFYLGIDIDSWVATAGKPFKARVVALDHEGKPVAAHAKLSLERVEVNCHESEGPYGYWECDRKREPINTREIDIGTSAPLSQEIVVPDPGHHMLRVETKDARGHLIKSSASLWVIGPGKSYWATDDSHRMGLIPSKRSFSPGDTAVLVPEAATDGATMLVTVERNGVLEARLEHGEGTAGIQIALNEAHAPNVFVSVALLRGRRGPKDNDRPEMKLGMVSLPVSFKQRALSVQISTEGSDFEPGQQVRGKVRVLGQDGAPVRAEVALSAADEGVLQVIDYRTPNPMDSFYAPWGLGVETAANWNRIAKLNDIPADSSEEEGADGAGSSADRVRSRFVASAHWAPALVTDAQGEAAFAFEAPDNLTAFRLMAAAADIGSRFGSAEQRIRVRKDLLIAPIVPRFVMADDKIELGAVIHNYTNAVAEVETTFDIAGVVPRKTTVRSKIAVNGKAVIHVPVSVQAADQLIYRAETALVNPSDSQRNARDKVELKLPVERAVVKDAETVFTGRGTTHKAALEWHRGIDAKASALEVSVDRTGMADLGPSLKYLIQYPYGCLEQTMSGLIPLLKVRELAKSLKLKDLSGEKLDRFIELGVAKVIRHQHADGQFSLWPDSTTYPHLTVYALWGLNEARRGGVRVEKRALDLGVNAIRTWANDGARAFAPGDETATLAMAAYVMAELGEPDPALNARLFGAKNALPIYGKAFLLRAMRRAKAAATDQQLLLNEIAGSVKIKDASATVDDPIAPESYYFSSASRSMALVLITLLEAEPSSALIAPLVVGLKQRRQGGRWASTQENVYGLLALSAYARAQATGKAKLKIVAGEQTLSDTTLVGSTIEHVRVPLASLTRGSLLTFEASEPVFYNAVLYKVRPEPVAAELDHGFGVRREYLGMESGQPVSNVHVGDLVRVRVHLDTAQGRRYVAVSDPLPSGFESVNTRLATERDVSEEENEDTYQAWFWDYRALRDERTDWFIDGLEAGPHVIDYIARATHVGTFTVPPARAEEMYQESVMGHSQSQVLTVVR